MNYATIANIENYTLQDVASSFETTVEEWIEGISRFADQYCNRLLVVDEESGENVTSAKYYDGNGKDWLSIDDCVSISTLKIGDIYGDDLTATTEYITYPRQAPFRKLILRSGIFTPGVQNVEVTAAWGFFSELPKDLSFAVTVLVAGIINSQKPSAQVKKSESIGNYSVTYIDDKGITDFKRAMAILDSYRRIDL